MEKWLWVSVIVISSLSVIGSAIIVAYVVRKKKERERKLGVSSPKAGSTQGTTQGKRWNRFIISYLFLCSVFVVIILYQSVHRTQGMQREAFDLLAVLVGALFFVIQAISRRNKAIRRELATVMTTAAYVKLESSMGLGDDHPSYDSIFEFTANGTTHYAGYHGKLYRKIGTQVELYYAPDNPNLIYVPLIEKSRGKVGPAILFFYGILFPFIGLMAPLLR